MTSNINKKLHYVQSEHNPQAMKELLSPKHDYHGGTKPSMKLVIDDIRKSKSMNKPEWMPENPCEECSKEAKNNHVHSDGWCHCDAKHGYGYEIAAQKKLLEYLKKSSQGFTKIYHWWDFESMLKELEGK